MGDEKFLSKLSINGNQYVIKDSIARTDIASISGLAFNGAESLSGQIADLKAHGADSALSGVNHVQTQLNSLSGLALDGATSLSGTIAALDAQEKADVISLSGSIETLKTKEQTDVNSLSGSIETLSGALKSAIEGLHANVTSTGGDRVQVQVTEADGKITKVTVTENDIASASGLAAETTARTTADTNLATAITGVYDTISGVIAGLDYTDTLASGEFITTVNQVDGKISVTRAGVNASQVTVTTASGITKTNVQGVLEDLALHISDAKAAGKVTMTSTDEGLDSGTLKRYTFTQGEGAAQETIGSIDIPKDLVVTGGSVFAATGGTTVTGATVAEGDLILQLNIANQPDKPVYIPVKSLTDVYTAGTTTEIATTLSGGEFSSTIVAGSIAKTKLDSAVQTSLDKADSAIQYVNGKPATGAKGSSWGGDVVLYGTDIKRTDSNTQTIEQALTGLEGSVSAIDTRVSGLEQWKAGITVTYHNETLNINGLVGSVGEPEGSGD